MLRNLLVANPLQDIEPHFQLSYGNNGVERNQRTHVKYLTLYLTFRKQSISAIDNDNNANNDNDDDDEGIGLIFHCPGKSANQGLQKSGHQQYSAPHVYSEGQTRPSLLKHFLRREMR